MKKLIVSLLLVLCIAAVCLAGQIPIVPGDDPPAASQSNSILVSEIVKSILALVF